jgi:hypothetical protein
MLLFKQGCWGTGSAVTAAFELKNFDERVGHALRKFESELDGKQPRILATVCQLWRGSAVYLVK